MVVASGGWMKPSMQYGNNFLEPQMNNNEMVVSTTNNSNMQSAKAVLISRPNSHPFTERVLTLDQSVKIGRSVARSRPTANNAIFDCKVLSRHHAMLWYENGKFFLQDTKSSNGTFVNNNRLSTSDTTPHEVSSGDIVQFGVDVVENNRKVTHGCIIATLKLFLPDGKEAKASPSITEGNQQCVVTLDELYQLNQLIQEASQREQCLESKLVSLQHVVDAAKKAVDDSWQAYIGEERLLSRISLLETQLGQANKAFSEDKLREELRKLQEDHAVYEDVTKESLRKSHEERLQISKYSSEQERARMTAEYEVLLCREQKDQAQLELQEVAKKLVELQKKADEERAEYEKKVKELQENLQTLQLLESAKLEDQKQGEILPMEALMKYDKIYKIDEENESQEVVLNKSYVINDNIQQENNEIILTNVNSGDIEVNQSPSSITIMNEKCVENKDELNQVKENETANKKENANANDEDDEQGNEVDYKTLKYQYQSMQTEQRKQIEQLEILCSANKTKIALLEKSLMNEKEENSYLNKKYEMLKEERLHLEEKYLEAQNDTKDLLTELASFKQKPNVQCDEKASQADQQEDVEASDHERHISKLREQMQQLEEEVVVLKERCVAVAEEKTLLNKELLVVHDKYNVLCNRSHNTLFFYVAPLALMVLYLLISSMFS